MTGLLFFYADRAARTSIKDYKIKSNQCDARLLGTIYHSERHSGHCRSSNNARSAQTSAYTVIVARKAEAQVNGPNLFLNTDYGATDIPVPEGLGPTAGRLYLEN